MGAGKNILLYRLHYNFLSPELFVINVIIFNDRYSERTMYFTVFSFAWCSV